MKDPYARLRGGKIILHGNWSCNHIFGRCSCGGLTVYGICRKCGTVKQCSWCNRYQVGKTWQMVEMIEKEKVTHGVCIECKTKLLEEVSGAKKMRL